jgi:hypothetical protein
MVLLVALFALALFRFGARESTSATLEGVVDQDGRIVTQHVLGEVHALLVERGDAFQLLMAYRVRDGWVALHVPQPLPPSEYAVEVSMGHAPVPPFTGVYGRVRGTLPDGGVMVRIAWSDGPENVPLIDGGFLAVRDGRFSVERVWLVGPGDRPLRDLARYEP